MRRIKVFLSIAALFISMAEPAIAGKKGVPGRRVGGGTRFTTPRAQPPSPQNKLSALAFASRNHLPASLKLRIIYG